MILQAITKYASCPFQAMARLESSLAQLRDLLAYLATVKGDLSHITAPPFVLAPKSAIEVPASWISRHALFLCPAAESDPARRALLVAQNFVCSLALLVDLGSEYAGKKPLNPFLGELFLGRFEGFDEDEKSDTDTGDVEPRVNGHSDIQPDSSTRFIAEQVSHHPPVTACYAYNRKHGISSRGFAAQETSFSPTSGVTVHQVGYAVIKDHVHDERHLMTLPTIQVKGIATGQLYPELEGRCYISSSSGFLTVIDLEGKGKLGMGTPNKVTAMVCESSALEKPLYRITGQWSGDMTIEEVQGGTPSQDFNISDFPITELSVAPESEQTEWESRRAWAKVLEGIRQGDTCKVSEHKSTIEQSQRDRRAAEKEQGSEWKSLFFKRLSHDEDAAELLDQIPDLHFDPERTAGYWGFVGIDEAEKLMQELK